MMCTEEPYPNKMLFSRYDIISNYIVRNHVSYNNWMTEQLVIKMSVQDTAGPIRLSVPTTFNDLHRDNHTECIILVIDSL